MQGTRRRFAGFVPCCVPEQEPVKKKRAPKRPLRWELQPCDGGTRLVLGVRVPKDEDPAKACAGFEGHLEMLAAALEGVPIRFPFDLFVQARKTYAEQVAALP